MVRRGIALAWGGLLAGVLLWQTSVRASRPGGIDLTSYLLSASALLHGASPYLLATPFPYLYPATLAFLLIPLTALPSTVALVVWFALNASAALWAVRRVVLLARPDIEHRPGDMAVFLAVFFTFFFSIVQSNLRNGQVNFVVLALCVAASLSRVRQVGRVGQAGSVADPAPPAVPALPALSDPPDPHDLPAPPGPSPLLWSLAIALKIVPAVLLPYFALRRRWLWMIGAVASCAAFLLMPAVIVGARIFDIYRQYWDVLRATSLTPRPEPLDFSLAGTISAITGAPVTPALRISAAAVVLGWILQVDGRRLRAEHARPLALYLLAIPLASPKSEVHHLAFMLPAAAILAAAWRWPSGAIGRAFLIAASMAAALYLAATIAPIAKGPMYCAALIAAAVALTKLRLKELPPERR